MIIIIISSAAVVISIEWSSSRFRLSKTVVRRSCRPSVFFSSSTNPSPPPRGADRAAIVPFGRPNFRVQNNIIPSRQLLLPTGRDLTTLRHTMPVQSAMTPRWRQPTRAHIISDYPIRIQSAPQSKRTDFGCLYVFESKNRPSISLT